MAAIGGACREKYSQETVSGVSSKHPSSLTASSDNNEKYTRFGINASAQSGDAKRRVRRMIKLNGTASKTLASAGAIASKTVSTSIPNLRSRTVGVVTNSVRRDYDDIVTNSHAAATQRIKRVDMCNNKLVESSDGSRVTRSSALTFAAPPRANGGLVSRVHLRNEGVFKAPSTVRTLHCGQHRRRTPPNGYVTARPAGNARLVTSSAATTAVTAETTSTSSATTTSSGRSRVTPLSLTTFYKTADKSREDTPPSPRQPSDSALSSSCSSPASSTSSSPCPPIAKLQSQCTPQDSILLPERPALSSGASSSDSGPSTPAPSAEAASCSSSCSGSRRTSCSSSSLRQPTAAAAPSVTSSAAVRSQQRKLKRQHSSSSNCKEAAGSSGTAQCKWQRCGKRVEDHLLYEHIHNAHVETQTDSQMFVCRWHDCKVFEKESCSYSWLERHILTHAGDKPFRCIVDACGQRFSSHDTLQRHINKHFASPSQPTRAAAKHDTPTKQPRRRRARKRTQGFIIRTEDYVDAQIMERVRERCVLFGARTGSQDGGDLTFRSTVIASRIGSDRQKQLLLRWEPPNVLPDEWLDEKDAKNLPNRTVTLTSTSAQQMTDLDPLLYSAHRYRKHRRK